MSDNVHANHCDQCTVDGMPFCTTGQPDENGELYTCWRCIEAGRTCYRNATPLPVLAGPAKSRIKVIHEKMRSAHNRVADSGLVPPLPVLSQPLIFPPPQHPPTQLLPQQKPQANQVQDTVPIIQCDYQAPEDKMSCAIGNGGSEILQIQYDSKCTIRTLSSSCLRLTGTGSNVCDAIARLNKVIQNSQTNAPGSANAKKRGADDDDFEGREAGRIKREMTDAPAFVPSFLQPGMYSSSLVKPTANPNSPAAFPPSPITRPVKEGPQNSDLPGVALPPDQHRTQFEALKAVANLLPPQVGRTRGLIACKAGANCVRRDKCKYCHPGQAICAASADDLCPDDACRKAHRRNSKQCKFWPCHLTSCVDRHEAGQQKEKSKVHCNYGWKCTKKECPFKHEIGRKLDRVWGTDD